MRVFGEGAVDEKAIGEADGREEDCTEGAMAQTSGLVEVGFIYRQLYNAPLSLGILGLVFHSLYGLEFGALEHSPAAVSHPLIQLF